MSAIELETISLNLYGNVVAHQNSGLEGVATAATEASDVQTQDETRGYPKRAELGLISMAVGMSLVLTGLDSTIVATAVPSITKHFRTYQDAGWYSSVYRLPLCAFQFMFGKLYKAFPTKTVFLISLVIFELGSAICGSAQSSIYFIIGRAIAGLGAAGIIAGCFSLLTLAVPLRYRPMATGFAGTAEGISSAIAPTIGGLITEKLGWRWCFYINLPFGALTIAILAILFKEPRRLGTSAEVTWKQKISQIDLIGTGVLVPSVTCLFMGMAWAGTKYDWANARIVVLFALAAVLLAAFAWVQYKKGDSATLPPRIISQRSILCGFLFSSCNNAALNVTSYYMPTYLQTIKQVSPSTSGLLIMPYIVAFILSTLCAGSAITMVGYYVPFMLTTSTLMPIATGLMTTLEVDSSLGTFIGYSTLMGLAGGTGFQSPQFAAQTILTNEDTHIGLAVVIFAQNFGPAIFLSIAQTVLSNRIVVNLQHYAPGVNATALEQAGLSDLGGHIPAGEVASVVQGYDKAITQTFYLSVGLVCLTMVGSVGMPWRSVKEKRS